MTVKIKVQSTADEALGLENSVRWVDFHFKPEKFTGFFVSDDEIIFMVDGETFSTSRSSLLESVFEKIVKS